MPIPICGFGAQMSTSTTVLCTVVLPFKTNVNKINITFQNVLHMPETTVNVILVAKLVQAGFKQVGEATAIQVYPGKQLTAQSLLSNGQFFVLQTDANAIMAALQLNKNSAVAQMPGPSQFLGPKVDLYQVHGLWHGTGS